MPTAERQIRCRAGGFMAISLRKDGMGRAGRSGAVYLAAGCCLLLAAGCSQPLTPPPITPTAPPPTPTLRPRGDSIPPGAAKWGPEEDPSAPVLHSDQWDQPIPVPGVVDTAGAEDSPFLLPDGKTLYFFFTPDSRIPAQEQLFDGVTGIYVAHLRSGAWADDERLVLEDPGALSLDGCPFVLRDKIWFCSAREGFTGVNLFTADLVGGNAVNWQYAGDQLNKDYSVGEMHITADGLELYFHSAKSGGHGGLDIWMSQKTSDGWAEPVNVAAVNTAGDEGWPFVSQNGQELWFTRVYQGSPAIFRSVRSGEGWGEPELIISQFAAEPSLDQQGNIYFAHHFIQDGQVAEADIYVAMSKAR